MDTDDEAMRRLRGADPAHGSQPDMWRIRSSVDRDIASGGGADEVVWEGRTVGRFGRGTAYLAAACVTALAVGVGGYALGQSRAPDGVTPAASSPDEDNDTQGESESSQGGDEPDLSSPTAAESGYAYGSSYMGDMGVLGSAVRLVPGDSLSTESGGEAEVLVQRSPKVDVDAEMTSMAQRLGIVGEVSGDDVWRSIRQDGRSVNAYPDASGLNLSYENTYLNYGCADMVAEMANWPEEMAPGGGSDLDADQCLPDPTEPISKQEAEATGRQLASDLGVDPATLTFTIYDEQGNQAMGSAVSTAKEGVRVQLDYTLRAEGVMSANMVLREDMSMGRYPVISAVEAVKRANDPIFGRLSIMPDGVSEEEWYSSSQEYAERPPVDPGQPIPVPGRVATAISAKLSTGTLVNDSGGFYTVPIYLITVDQGRRMAVLALTEDDIALQD